MQTQESKTEAKLEQEAHESIVLAVAWSALLNGDEPWKGCVIVPSRESMRNPA